MLRLVALAACAAPALAQDLFEPAQQPLPRLHLRSRGEQAAQAKDVMADAPCKGWQCLADYVAKPDDHYTWNDTGVRLGGISLDLTKRWTGYVLNMTSQKWLDETKVSRSIWWHTLVVIVPSDVRYADAGLLWITGGYNENPAWHPKSKDEDILLAAELAMATGVVSAALFQVPNAGIVFADDPSKKNRHEDAIIAWTWKQFVENPAGSTEVPLRLPMTKAAVRALDCMTEWSKGKIQRFGVAGASKRGWTTWTVAAVDKRVIAAVPIVMDELNFVKNLHHHWKAYGGWSFAMEDYLAVKFPQYLDTPELDALMDIVDPFAYPEKLAGIPKLVVNAGNDEFFLPDDTRFWWDVLPEPKQFLMVPNAEHSQATGVLEILPAVGIWFETILDKTPQPDFQWSIDNVTGEITANLTQVNGFKGEVERVNLWHATTCDNIRRDFRIVNTYPIDECKHCGILVKNNSGICANLRVLWSAITLQETFPGSKVYQGLRPVDSTGRWTAFFLDAQLKKPMAEGEVGWPIGHKGVFEFTTAVSIIPQTFPFPDCSGKSCGLNTI